MKKRLIAASILTASLGFGFLAARAQQPTEIEFWTWYLSPNFDGFINGVIADFEKANPGIKVKHVDKQDTIERDFVAQINLGNAPDVVNFWNDSTFAAVQSNLLTPLDELVPADFVKSTYYENVTKIFTIGGKVYGFPWYGYVDQGVMAYNSELFKKAGLTKLPTTNKELINLSRIIKRKTGAYGWIPSVKDPNGASMLGQFFLEGLPITTNGQAAFNTVKHAAVLQTFVNLMKEDVIPQDILRKEAFQVTNELYTQGKAAFIVGGPQALTRVRDSSKDIYAKTKVVAAPLGSAGVQTGGAFNVVVPRASKNKKEAALFAQFLTNNVNQIKFAKVVPIVPTTKAAEKDPAFDGASDDAITKATNMVATTGGFINPGWTPPAKNSDAILKNFNDNIEAAFLGKKTPLQALQDAAAYWNANNK